MDLVIDHLTRMRDECICVAGLAPDGTHVRPVLRTGRWTRAALRGNGGPFSVGARVDIGRGKPYGRAPEMEDHVVATEAVEFEGQLRDAAFWELVSAAAQDTLSACFGPELTRTPRGRASVPNGQGSASLGLLRVDDVEFIATREALRIEFDDPDLGRLNLGVTDVRMHRPDGDVRLPLIRPCAQRVAERRPLVLAVGLSRPFGPDAAHWLQVNNIHFEDYLDDHPTFRG